MAASQAWRVLLNAPQQPANATVQRVKWALVAVGLLPLLRLVAGYFLGWLGANPIEFITRSTGTGRWSALPSRCRSRRCASC